MEQVTVRKSRITKEKANLKKSFKANSKEKQEIIDKLIDRAAFLLIMSQDMEQELMSIEKYTSTTINASQTFTKANPLLKDYRETVKSYQTVLKQLCDFTKDEKSTGQKDELEDFLGK